VNQLFGRVSQKFFSVMGRWFGRQLIMIPEVKISKSGLLTFGRQLIDRGEVTLPSSPA